MNTLQTDLANILAEKIIHVSNERQLNLIRIFDIGLFPWHESIELSFLCEGDMAEEEDVADWPLYNVSNIQEGEWLEALPICRLLNTKWKEEANLAPMLEMFASALKSAQVQKAIGQLPLASTFKIQLLDPDDPDSPNYYA